MLEQIMTLLQKRSLAFEETELDTISTGFATALEDGSEHGFPLFIMHIEDAYGERFIRFTIVPFIEQPFDGYSADMFIMIGQINHDLPQLKFAFDGDGDLELILDLPFAELDDVHFDRALQLLADYAGTYYPELALVVVR
jgi:hypothetical protein